LVRRPRKTDPDAAPPREPREFNLLQLLPNFLTVGAICAGLTAIRFAIQGSFEMSVALIILAAALDGLDGRLARLLRSESAIGAELDSLADFLNFGVAPALFLYLWALQDARSEGWIAVLVYAVCCVMRLARFNVGAKASTGPEDKQFFTGVPAPAGALLVMLPFYIAKLMPDAAVAPAIVVVLQMVLVGLLMISRLPTPSLKATTFAAENVKFVVIGFVTFVAALLTYPWATLAFAAGFYLMSLVWAWRQRRRPPKPAPGD
jgi:CDP-diacylglycerol--serine O-phosphatidyltransferase